MNIGKLKAKAAKDRSISSIIKVAEYFAKRADSKDSLREAKKWYKKASDRGDADASFSLARLYDQEPYSTRAKKCAAKYFRVSADQGSVQGLIEFAWCVYYGDGVEESEKKAAELFESVADKCDRPEVLAPILRIRRDRAKKWKEKYI